VFPLGEFVATLRALEFDGVVSAEVLSKESREQPPLVGARILADALRAAWPPAVPSHHDVRRRACYRALPLRQRDL
jgi:hypothetical protein